MISIVEQERRAAVKSYRESMAMVESDALEEAYSRGWSDAKDMLPSNVVRLVCFFAGVFVGAVIVWIVS